LALGLLVGIPIFILVSGFGVSRSCACDTIEPYDIGVTDFEAYASLIGVGKHEPDRGFSAEVLLGIGIMEWFSAHLYGGGESNWKFSEGAGFFGFGVFATPLDLNHFDIDLGINVTVGGLGQGAPAPADHSQAEFTFTPFVELNLDSDSDMSGYGLYVQVFETLGGRDESRFTDLEEEIRDFTLTPGTALVVGSYLTVVNGQQLFLCYDMAFNHRAADDERKTDVGGVAVGYNACLNERIELITEVFFDIPQDGENFGVDFIIGFIATLPSWGS